MNLDEFCSGLFENFPKIRYAAIHHISSEQLAGGMRDGVKSYLPLDEMTKSIHNTILRWKTRESLYPFLGSGQYSITKYDQVKRLTFPLRDAPAILVVGIEVEVDHDLIINKIIQLIN